MVIALLAWPAVLAVGWLIRKILGLFPGISAGAIRFVQRLAQAAVVLVAISFSLSALNIGPGTIAVTVIVVAIVVGVILQAIIQNMAAALALPYLVGDDIETHGYTGTVFDITLRQTVIETRDRRKVYVPNVDVMAKPIVKYTAFDHRRSEIEIGVMYATDVAEVSHLLVDAIADVDGVHEEPPPYAKSSGFGDGMYRLTLRWWHDPSISVADKLKGDVYTTVKETLDDAGIPIPPPIGVFLSETP